MHGLMFFPRREKKKKKKGSKKKELTIRAVQKWGDRGCVLTSGKCQRR